jgi:hypothetical protein
MAKKTTTTMTWVLVAAAAAAVWYFFIRDSSPAAALVSDLATGKQPSIPQFGTDAILDTADAIASSTLTLPTGTP